MTGNRRQYYTTTKALLDAKEWQNYFIGVDRDESTIKYTHKLPEAFAKALQFVNYKLNDYDLSADAKATLKANTVMANDPRTITGTADKNGMISPSGEVTIYVGEDQTFTITPNEGYEIADVLVDGVSVGAVSSYTFKNVTGDHTIEATFRRSGGSGVVTPARYTITAEAGDGGSVSPDGRVRVDRGDDQTFTITPDDDYEIADVLVDGESVGAVSSYTFENVCANHTIEVVFEEVMEPEREHEPAYLNTEDHYAYIAGYTDGTVRPDAYITRTEAVTLINRMLDRAPDAGHLLADMIRWPDNPETAWYYANIQEATNSHDYTLSGNGDFEVWTELLVNRDWAALEEIWSQANDAPAARSWAKEPKANTRSQANREAGAQAPASFSLKILLRLRNHLSKCGFIPCIPCAPRA